MVLNKKTKLSQIPDRSMREFIAFTSPASSLSPAGDNIARFFLRLRRSDLRLRQGALPPITPARELSSLDLPLFAQNHAAALARPRSARTLRVSLCGLRRTGWVTLGALPLIPHQETEFPGPSTFTQNPETMPYRPKKYHKPLPPRINNTARKGGGQ